MFKFAFLVLFLFQQSDEVSITSDLGRGKQECVESPEQVCTWTGGVTVTYQDVVVKAETATYNHTKHALSAENRVLFTRADERLEGDSLDLDLSKKAGTLVGVKGNLGPGYFFSAGKALHLTAYAVFALLTSRLPSRRRIFILIVVLHAPLTEFLQQFTGRTASLWDVGLDWLGVTLGVILSWRRWGGRADPPSASHT